MKVKKKNIKIPAQNKKKKIRNLYLYDKRLVTFNLFVLIESICEYIIWRKKKQNSTSTIILSFKDHCT